MSVNIYKNNQLTPIVKKGVGSGSSDYEPTGSKWIGTQDEWDALTDKSIYDGKEVIITDDMQSNVCSSVAGCVASTNANDVAGASALAQLNKEINASNSQGIVDLSVLSEYTTPNCGLIRLSGSGNSSSSNYCEITVGSYSLGYFSAINENNIAFLPKGCRVHNINVTRGDKSPFVFIPLGN